MNAYTILNDQFTVFTDIESGRKIAKCNYCDAMLKYHHSTSSLTYHLRCKHSIGAAPRQSQNTTPGRPPAAFPVSASGNPQETLPGSGVPSLPNYLDIKPPIEAESTNNFQQNSNVYATDNNIDTQLALWIAKDGRPIEIVEDEGLKNLLTSLAWPRTLEFPSKFSISDDLESLFYKEKRTVKNLLTHSPYLTLTTDNWVTGADSFSALRAHFISADWKYESTLLGVERSTVAAVSVDEHLTSLASDWGIDILQLVSHIVINSLGPVNDSEGSKFKRTPCFAHLLKLSINNALVACTLDDKVEKEILGYYNCHINDDPLKALKHHETTVKMNQIPVDQDISTAWRRTYLMLNFLIANKSDTPHQNQPLEEKWNEFVDLHKLFEPLEKAISILGGNGYTTASSVLPLIAYLRQQMAPADRDTSYIQEFKKVFLGQFNTSIENLLDDENLRLAIALDIRYKRLFSIPSDKRAGIWSLLKSVTRNIIETTSADETETKCKIPRTAILSLAGGEQGLAEDDSVMEFEMYKHLPQINDDDQCPLQWWRQNETTYPVLSKLAKRYLSIPATSVPCEHLFSDAGDKLNRKRSALGPDDVVTICCLSDWLNESEYG